MILIATLGGLVALVFWGMSDYFAGKSGRLSDAYLCNFLMQATGTALLLPVVIWYGKPIPLDLVPLGIVLAISLSFTVAFVSSIKAFAIGPFGVLAPIANSFPLITMLFAFGFFGFTLSPLHLVALLIIVGGVIILATDTTTFDYGKWRGLGVRLAIVAALFWGVGLGIFDAIVNDFFWLHFLFLLNIFMATIGGLLYLGIHHSLPSYSAISLAFKRYSLQTALVGVVGSSAFFATSEHVGSVVIPAVISSASVLVTALLARIYDNERLTFYKRLGAVVVVLGLMLLNVL